MSRVAFLALALVFAGCVRRTSCPPIDEHALARQVVAALLHPDAPVADDTPVTSSDSESDDEGPIPYSRLPRRGPADAEVRIVVISDFQCPFCGRYARTLERALDAYEGTVALYFVNYPLPFHENAEMAAEAGVEARRQGGDDAFYRMHDRMFANQDALTADDLVRHAVAIGLDGDAMRRALESGTHADEVEADMELATELDVSGTPTSVVGTEIISGAVDYGTLRAAIERARDR